MTVLGLYVYIYYIFPLTLPNIWTPLIGNRQYLPDEKVFGDTFFLLVISAYLTHFGQILWLYHYNFSNYDRFSKGGGYKIMILRSNKNNSQVANT